MRKASKKASKPKLVRLTEGDLHNIINECVRKALRKTSKKARRINESSNGGWMGVEGARYISHGEWADPEIIYNGDSFDYYDFEDVALADYKSEHPEDGNYEGYDEWLQQQGPDYVRDILDELSSSMWENEEAGDTDKWFAKNHQDLLDSAYDAYYYDDLSFEDWVKGLDHNMRSDRKTLERAWEMAEEEARKNRRWG